MSYPIFPASALASGSSKLPIPRLHKQRGEPPRRLPVNRQNRVSRACLSCRIRKIKCNGQQPQCSNCIESASSCVYASSRKDRLKTATQQNQDLIAMLQDLRQHQSTERAARIDDLLASVAEDVADAAATVQDPTDKYRGRLFDDERGEANVSAEVQPDLLDEDIMRNEETSTTGSVGRASEIQWLRKLHDAGASEPSDGGLWGPPVDDEVAVNERLEAPRERQGGHATPPLMLARKASFYLDDEVFEMDMLVDPFEMPPYDVAKRLLSAYMGSAHNSFPILTKQTFVNRFHHYYTSLQRGNPCDVPRIWQATLNVVFAIGAVYSRLTIVDRQTGGRDDLVYHSRAWALSLKHPWWFSYPDLPHMQITGLLSFYYLSIGYVNRSWVLIGNAMRLGFALGMHLYNEDGHSGAVHKELNSRIWWAHYALERLISALTGRPSLGTGSLCSVPLPLPLSTDDPVESAAQAQSSGNQGKHSLRVQISPGSSQVMDFSTLRDLDYDNPDSGHANSGSYLRSMVNLGEITQSALALYSTDTVRGSWESVQRSIAQGNEALDVWATDLPEELNFLHRSNVINHRYRREQNVLGIMYHSTKILTTRPCLCRLDRWISYQTANSNTFNQRAALLCVESAKSISNILPDAVANNLDLLYQEGPWWQMVHVIMQALVVLLLEIVLESRYSPNNHQDTMPSMKKLLYWLRVMRVNNGVAFRAYSLSLGLVKKLAPIVKMDIREFINEDEMIMSTTEPSPATSAPASTHTPYPDVLNPVEGPVERSRATNVSFAAPATKQTSYQQQQQQQERQERQQFMYGPSSDAQHRPTSSQKQSPQTNQNTEPFQLPSRIFEHGLRLDLSSYKSIFDASSGYEQSIFPGCFVTSFDEHNLFAGTEF